MKSWSSTQSTVATSSGEADYNALVRRAAEAWGLKAVLDELGWEIPDIMIDSAAAKSIVFRLGLGKQRHIEVKLLWAQETLGTTTPPDIQAEVIRRHSGSAGWCRRLESGRSDQTPVLPEQLRAHVPGDPTQRVRREEV